MDNISVPISEKTMEEYTNEYVSELMGRYADSVLRMCYIYLKDYHLAEDVTQKTFIRVIKYYGKFTLQGSVNNFVYEEVLTQGWLSILID